MGGKSLAGRLSEPMQHILLKPANIYIAVPVPTIWQVPEKFWQLWKAILCWQIWKNRNEHYMAGKQASARKVIQKAAMALIKHPYQVGMENSMQAGPTGGDYTKLSNSILAISVWV